MGKLLNISSIDYNPTTKSLDISVAGCFRECKNCNNKDFAKGSEYHSWIDSINSFISRYDSSIEAINLVGGFNSQNNLYLTDFIIYLSSFHDKDLHLYTDSKLSEVQSIFKEYCDFIHCGKCYYTPNNVTYINGVHYNVR